MNHLTTIFMGLTLQTVKIELEKTQITLVVILRWFTKSVVLKYDVKLVIIETNCFH